MGRSMCELEVHIFDPGGMITLITYICRSLQDTKFYCKYAEAIALPLCTTWFLCPTPSSCSGEWEVNSQCMWFHNNFLAYLKSLGRVLYPAQTSCLVMAEITLSWCVCVWVCTSSTSSDTACHVYFWWKSRRDSFNQHSNQQSLFLMVASAQSMLLFELAWLGRCVHKINPNIVWIEWPIDSWRQP